MGEWAISSLAFCPVLLRVTSPASNLKCADKCSVWTNAFIFFTQVGCLWDPGGWNHLPAGVIHREHHEEIVTQKKSLPPKIWGDWKNKGVGENPDSVLTFLLPTTQSTPERVWTWYASKYGKLSSGLRNGKGHFSFHLQRRAMPNNVQTTTQLRSFYILARSCWNSSKLGFNSTWTENFWMYKLNLEKTEEPDQIANICRIIEKERKFQKNI